MTSLSKAITMLFDNRIKIIMECSILQNSQTGIRILRIQHFISFNLKFSWNSGVTNYLLNIYSRHLSKDVLGNVRIKMFKRKFSFYCKTSILKWTPFLYSMTIIAKKSEMYKVVSILILFHLLKIRSMHITNFTCITNCACEFENVL